LVRAAPSAAPACRLTPWLVAWRPRPEDGLPAHACMAERVRGTCADARSASGTTRSGTISAARVDSLHVGSLALVWTQILWIGSPR
jgi:hypothetical protein